MYYLWLNEAQAGPYTLQQVQAMWNAGQLTALSLYWQEGNAEWQPLSTIISEIEPNRQEEVIARTTVIPELQKPDYRKANKEAAQRAIEAADKARAEQEKDLWKGHPTLWRWAWLVALGVVCCLLPIGLYAGLNQPLIIATVPLSAALVIFGYVYVARNATKYVVTTKRVGLETGILTRTSKELRVQDIRSIAAEVNFLGYGNIEFSSAASDDADVVFHAVSGATSVRDMVKKLQS